MSVLENNETRLFVNNEVTNVNIFTSKWTKFILQLYFGCCSLLHIYKTVTDNNLHSSQRIEQYSIFTYYNKI